MDELLLTVVLVIGLVLYVVALKKTAKSAEIPCPHCKQPLQPLPLKQKDLMGSKPLRIIYVCQNPTCPLSTKPQKRG